MKILQSTNTFQRSRKISNWDQSGQTWKSEHTKDSQPKVTQKSNEPKATPPAPKAAEPKVEKADLRGKEPKAISFKRQIQQDTFNGTTVVARKPKPFDTVKTVLAATFGIGCVGIGVLTKNKI